MTPRAALRAVVLDHLRYSADHLRGGHHDCGDCQRRGGPCPDRQRDLIAAEEADAAAALIARVASDHWLVAVLRGEPGKETP
jgi:hypothetical protein